MTESSQWLMIRMDMLPRLLGPWGRGSSRQQKAAWEYDKLYQRDIELSWKLVHDGNDARRDN